MHLSSPDPTHTSPRSFRSLILCAPLQCPHSPFPTGLLQAESRSGTLTHRTGAGFALLDGRGAGCSAIGRGSHGPCSVPSRLAVPPVQHRRSIVQVHPADTPAGSRRLHRSCMCLPARLDLSHQGSWTGPG